MKIEVVTIPVEELEGKLKGIIKACIDEQAPEEILTREKTCALLDISIATLKKWTKAGKLKAHNMGDRVYFLRSELIERIKEINKAA